MTLNDLIRKGNSITRMLTSGDIPLTMNGKPLELDITLEGDEGNYSADIKCAIKEPVSDDLRDAANDYGVNIRKGYPRVMDETDRYIFNAFKAGANWQLNKMKKESVKIKKGCKYRSISNVTNIDTGNICFVAGKIYLAPKDDTLVSEENGWLCDVSENSSNFELVEEPVSEELIEELKKIVNIRECVSQGVPVIKIACHFAQWMKEQMMENSIEREVKIDAGGYPYIDCNIEFYDYDKDVPLAKKGDKVKLIVIQDGQE